MASADGNSVVFDHVRSPSFSVRDATYFLISFMRSAKGSPARSGQAPAMTCQVRRPKSRASVWSIASPMKAPIVSGSKNGIDQPPCWKPPSVSSSRPPGAWTTPSRLMKSLITIRIVGSFSSRSLVFRRCESVGLIGATHRPGIQVRLRRPLDDASALGARRVGVVRLHLLELGVERQATFPPIGERDLAPPDRPEPLGRFSFDGQPQAARRQELFALEAEAGG